jgi:hypothetical protein
MRPPARREPDRGFAPFLGRSRGPAADGHPPLPNPNAPRTGASSGPENLLLSVGPTGPTEAEESTMNYRYRTVLASMGVCIGMAVLAPGVAAADEVGSEDQVREQLCEVRIPRLENRVDAAQSRIDGDADTVGSVSNLEQRSDEAEAEGDTELADQLDARADRREGLRTDQLGSAQEQLDETETNQCS